MNSGIETILLDHGAGGRAGQQLVSELFLHYLGGQDVSALEDCAVLEPLAGRLAVTTDSFVVSPVFFPGGNIGDLAINGTVNDLAMRGARPLYLTAGFILEEGLPVADLRRILSSMSQAAEKSGVRIIAGDTKVVPKGAADRIFINTSGIGVVSSDISISVTGAKPGDRVIMSGSLADHGLAVMTCREGLQLQSPIISDTVSLGNLVERMLEAGGRSIHVLRDPTRGGVATSLNEIAQSSGVRIEIEENRLPIGENVRGVCDILGLDPLYVANEGKLLAVVAPEAANQVLTAMKKHPDGREAVMIGQVTASPDCRVILKTAIGGSRVVDMLTGQQFPRIC
jgi:hydrogenase expression/formation protein HypE